MGWAVGNIVSMADAGAAILERKDRWETVCAQCLVAGGMWPEDAAVEVAGLQRKLKRGTTPESAAEQVLSARGFPNQTDQDDLV